MGYKFLPPNTQVLFEQTLDTNSFQLIGTIPSQYPTGITVYVMNYQSKNTIQCQCIITRHRTANDANVFNKTMYIPPNNMAKFTNFTNIAGLNVFLKTSGTKCVALITQSNETASGSQFINATPTVINQDQTIIPMPAPEMVNANSTDTQLMQLRGLINTISQQSSTLQTTFQQQYATLTNKLGVLALTIDSVTNIQSDSSQLSAIIESINSLSNISSSMENSIDNLESENNALSSTLATLSANIDNLISSSQSLPASAAEQINSNTEQLKKIDSNIQNIDNTVESLSYSISSLTEEINNSYSDIDNISSATQTLSSAIENINVTLTNLSELNDSDIISLSDEIDYLSSQIENLSSQVLNTVPIGSSGNVNTAIVSGPNGGTITITTVTMGPYKKILLTFVNYINDSGNIQYINYNSSFEYSPIVVSTVAKLTINTTLSQFVINPSLGNTVYSGTIIIEGI